MNDTRVAGLKAGDLVILSIPDLLELFVIYEDPRDFPGEFVVRRWSVNEGRAVPDLAPLARTSDLDGARAALPVTVAWNLGRQEGDDPAIRETWI